MIKKAYFLLVLLSTMFPLILVAQSTIPQAKAETFTFPIREHGLYLPDHRFFVAASQAIPGNDFAISAIDTGSTLLLGLTPAEIMVNNVAKQPNPLHGAAISHLSLIGPWPIVAKEDNPSLLFLLDNLRQSQDSRKQIFQSSPIRDGNNAVARSLFAIETIASSVSIPLEATATMAAFAAVGDTSRENELSLALLFFNKFKPKAKTKTNNGAAPEKNGEGEKLETPIQDYYGWDIVDAKTGVHEFLPDGQPTGKGNKARLITLTTPELIINGALSMLTHAADLHYDRDMGRLYAAFRVRSGAGANDGARAVLVGSIKDGTLKFQEIAPSSAFTSRDGIVGGRGANVAVTIYKVRTLFTKTLLRYLIVVGGNGNDPELTQDVYALPLVDDFLSPSVHGTLANVKSQPVDRFSRVSPYRFEGRGYKIPAIHPDEIFSQNDLAARVGGDALLPGAITDITVARDAVMVSVAEAGNSLEPGIFSSQPMYDAFGRIRGWTNWQRVAGTNLPIIGFNYDPALAIHWYIPQAVINNGKIAQSFDRTQWTDSKDPFSYFVATEFPPGSGGVQGLFDFPVSTPSFSQTLGTRLSLMLYTGFEKIMILQTGSDAEKNGLFGPSPFAGTDIFRSTDGSLKGFKPSSILVLSGGALSSIGPVSSAAIVSDSANGWFAVAGSHGIAILAAADGSSWSTNSGLSDHFGGINESLRWQLIRPTKNVRKLISSGNQLFVLSDTTLERLEISASALARNEVAAVTLAKLTHEEMCQSSSYSDCIITGPLGLLATSFGLFRSGNGIDIRLVSAPLEAQWTHIVLPEAAGSLSGQGPASRLFAVTPTLDEGDLIQGGTLYVLNGYVGLNQAQLYRFAVQSENQSVTASTVQLFPDYFIKGRKTFFANPGEYRNYIVTDGALLALSRSAYGLRFPFLELLSGVRNQVLWLAIPEAHSMGKLIRNSASGAWVASGDFGVRVLA